METSDIKPARTWKARDTLRWYKLLIRLGIDEFMQAILDRPRFDPKRGVTAKEQKQGYSDNRDEFAPIKLMIDFPKLFRELAEKEAFYEFVAIVLGVPIEEAPEQDMVEFAVEAPLFVHFSLEPLRRLFGISSFFMVTDNKEAEVEEA